MTLDEAIKYAEEVAIEEDKLCKRSDDASGYTRSHNEEIRSQYAKNYEKRAAEHRQLAEWLKDYKRLLEQEPCEDCISRQAAQDYIAKYLSQFLYNDVRQAVEVIDEYIGELPSVAPQPKTGYWTKGDSICPCCGEDKFKDLDADIWSDWQPKYCPNCGARMEVEE